MSTYMVHPTEQSDLYGSLGGVAGPTFFVALGQIRVVVQEILVVVTEASRSLAIFSFHAGQTYFHMASQPISTSDFTPSCHHFLVAADVISDQEPFSEEPTPDDQIEVVTVAGGS